jgi:hypothetical protein
VRNGGSVFRSEQGSGRESERVAITPLLNCDGVWLSLPS